MADSDNLISCSQQTCKKNDVDMVDKWKMYSKAIRSVALATANTYSTYIFYLYDQGNYAR